MPATTPPIADQTTAALAALGARIRGIRKQMKVSAANAAEAAGVSRPTLHRIERGEAAVTIGAWLNVIAALGLDLKLDDPAMPLDDDEGKLPQSVRITDYPQLRRLAWQVSDAIELTPRQALALYERNWRHVDPEAMDDGERAFVKELAQAFGGGRLLV
jgi:transcriptional regulator with XRE-family HTH domain